MGCSSSIERPPDILSRHVSTYYDESSLPKKTIPQSTRFLENFLIVWLHDETSNKYENDVHNARHIFYGLKTFDNINGCLHFINNVQDEKVFLIISDIHRACERFLPLAQIEKIYIFESSNEVNDSKYRTFKCAIVRDINDLYQQLQEDIRLSEIDFIPITAVSIPSQELSLLSKLSRQQASFLYALIMKEITARFKFESCSKDVLINFCRANYINCDEQSRVIDEFAKNYRPNKALSYLTHQCFISKILNRVQRTHEVDVLYKFGFFVKQVQIQLNRLHEENRSIIETISLVYLGKTMSSIEFDSIIQHNSDGFLTFPNFLIASANKKLAMDFVQHRLEIHRDMIGILFEIEIDHTAFDEKSPFALLNDTDSHNDKICFYISTIFRIESVEQMNNRELPTWCVKLKLINDNDPQLRGIVASTRKDDIHSNPGYYLAKLLMEMGEYRRAEHFLLGLLQDSAVLSQPRRLVRVHNGLAAVYAYKHEQGKALTHYQEVLRLSLTYLQEDHPDLAPIYKAIGDNHLSQKDYIQALENYEKAIKLFEKSMSQANADIITNLQNSMNIVKQFIETYK